MQSVLKKGHKKMGLDSGDRFIASTFSELESTYNPMSGYQAVPLMSLEEAVQSIKPFIPDVMTHVATAKEKCTRNAELNINESAAVYLYTMESAFYININKRLRNENRSDLEPCFAYLKLFITALLKLPVCVAAVWRGIRDVVVSDFDQDKEHIWWSVNSCTRHVHLARGFTCGHGILFCIESVYGRDIGKYSANKTEGEVILLPGTHLRVNGISLDDDGVSIIHLQQSDIIPQGKHVMLSYHENDRVLITKIGNSLRSQNIPVWYNEQGDMFNIRDSLAVGVEDAAVICCFMTSDYQTSIHCKIELQYAQKRSRKIIPCMLSDPNIWKPSGWLESVTHGLKCIGFDVITETPDIDYITLELRCHIHEMYSSPKQVSSTTVDKPSYLYELVKYDYLRKSCIKRLLNPAISFPVEQSYINLVIVQAKHQQAQEKQMHEISHDTAILGTYEDIYGLKTSIHVNNIFETCKTHEKQVLVFGRAGIGKSTFCRFVAYQWAADVYWSQYELLVVIPLRNLTTSEYAPLQNGQTYSLMDIVRREVFKNKLSKKDKELLEEQFDDKKILWILDGYDEIAQNVPSHLKHLLSNLLDTPHHVLTSRPYLNTLSYKVQMEITGFTDENVQQYVEQFFDQMKDELKDTSYTSEALFKHIKSNTRLWGVAHVPLMLEIICSLWNTEDGSKMKSLTIIELYTTMVRWVCRRYLEKQNMNIQVMSKTRVDQCCQKELTFLSILAFKAIELNHIIISPELLEQALEEADMTSEDQAHVLNIGVLKSFNRPGTGTQIEMDKDHYFIHLSFQEYFAAQYLVQQLRGSIKTNAVEFIKYQKYNQRYALMFTFIAGLLCQDQKGSACNIFWDTLQEEPTDLVGVRHMQLIISCLEATYEHVHIPQRTELLKQTAQIIQNNLRPRNTIIYRHLSQSFRAAQSIMHDATIVNTLINLLQNDNPDVKTLVFQFIAATSVTAPPTELCTSIAIYIADKNDQVRRRACDALGEIGEKAATTEVIDKLVSALADQREGVRSSACRALGQMGEKAATTEVIDKLVSALADEEEGVRSSACGALGQMSEKAATTEVIDKLVSTLADEKEWVRSSACRALGQMGEKAATTEVIDKLVSAPADQRDWVRSSACRVLGQMGEKAATTEVIDKLVSALADEEEGVRRSACDALGQMGEKAATTEVIDKLVTALADEEEGVRRSACRVLGQMGEKAATTEVIDKLVTALADQRDWVRSSACDALGQMGEKAATTEVIDKLVSALADEEERVRISACRALGKMGEKAATTEVIDKLGSALADQSDEVHRSACDVLGQMGEKAATAAVVQNILKRSSNKDVFTFVARNRSLTKMLTISNLAKLDPNDFSHYYLRRSCVDALESFSLEQLFNIWLQTKNCGWLPIIAHALLLRAAAVVLRDEGIAVYETKEPIEIPIESEDLRKELQQSMLGHRKQLFFSFES